MASGPWLGLMVRRGVTAVRPIERIKHELDDHMAHVEEHMGHVDKHVMGVPTACGELGGSRLYGA